MNRPVRALILKRHWPEYLLEAFGLGLFMVSACGFGILLFHPASPVPALIPSPFERRALMGTAMGLTAIVNIYSPWGRRSGAHLNPAVTLTFLRLGKVDPRDTVGYIAGQFAGGVLGTLLAAAVFHRYIADPSVNYVATVPGPGGWGPAFLGELVISFGLMLTVLTVASHPRLTRLTGCFAATLVALYITFEAPISGMSMNPARTVGSAIPAMVWDAWWIYFTAPPLGMLLASELHRRFLAAGRAHCAKMDHDPAVQCIFCEYHGGVRSSGG